MENKKLNEHLEEDRNKYFNIHQNSGDFFTSCKAYDVYKSLRKVIEHYKDTVESKGPETFAKYCAKYSESVLGEKEMNKNNELDEIKVKLKNLRSFVEGAYNMASDSSVISTLATIEERLAEILDEDYDEE